MAGVAAVGDGEAAPPRLNRRQIFVSALLVAGAAGVPLWLASGARDAPAREANADERRLLAVVSDLVIPATATGGALAAGVPAFVERALKSGLEGTRDPGPGVAIAGGNGQPLEGGGLFLIRKLREALDANADGAFVAATPGRRAAALEAVDAAAFGPDGKDHVWHKIKNLILLGYYTSEIGGSQELAYELVPGRWDPDVPLAQQPRAFSSDWTAVDFG